MHAKRDVCSDRGSSSRSSSFFRDGPCVADTGLVGVRKVAEIHSDTDQVDFEDSGVDEAMFRKQNESDVRM